MKLKGALIPLLLVLIWAGVSAAELVNSYLLPPPRRKRLI